MQLSVSTGILLFFFFWSDMTSCCAFRKISELYLLHSMLSLTVSIVPATIGIKEPFVIGPNDTVSSLYQAVNARINATCEISIVFGGKIILNLANDYRSVTAVGMNEILNDIQIIRKPDCVSLLEMVDGVINKEQIPWFNQATECLSDPSSNRCQNVCRFGHGLECDDSGNLIGIDLSHLNLTGSIRLESLPSSVEALDLSFNDLNTLDLDALRGKSLEKLNVEQNGRCRMNTKCFYNDSGPSLPLRELQVSIYQTLPWVTKHIRTNNWFYHQDQRTLNVLTVDGARLSLENPMPFKMRMLKVVEGVTNQELIPWFHKWNTYQLIPVKQLKRCGISYRQNRGGIANAYKVNLSGLGLRGHIDLGYLPRNVYNVDLSNNNLSSISFVGDGEYNLRGLNLENNHNLRIDLMQIDCTTTHCCLCSLYRLRVSSSQLSLCQERIWEWLVKSRLRAIVIDGVEVHRLSLTMKCGH